MCMSSYVFSIWDQYYRKMLTISVSSQSFSAEVIIGCYNEKNLLLQTAYLQPLTIKNKQTTTDEQSSLES